MESKVAQTDGGFSLHRKAGNRFLSCSSPGSCLESGINWVTTVRWSHMRELFVRNMSHSEIFFSRALIMVGSFVVKADL